MSDCWKGIRNARNVGTIVNKNILSELDGYICFKHKIKIQPLKLNNQMLHVAIPTDRQNQKCV